MFDTVITVLRVILGISILQFLNTINLIKGLYWTAYTQVWDVNLHIANQFAPERNPKAVIPAGKAGANGTCAFIPIIIVLISFFVSNRRLVKIHVFAANRR